MFTPTPAPSQTESVFDKHTEFNHSSALKQAWYSTAERSLVVQTHEGDCYQYVNVVPMDWEHLTTTASPGRYWADIRRHYGGSISVPEPTVSQDPSPQAVVAKDAQYQASVTVSGTFTMRSDAGALEDAVREFNAHLARKFKDTDLNFVIQSVERV